MADNKATALKDAKSEYQLKVYYNGETPEECGQTVVYSDVVDGRHTPWLIKWHDKETNRCYQFADTVGIYHKVSQELADVLDAVIVNVKQRQALDKIIDKMLWDYLGLDMAHSGDIVLDPLEF